MRKLEELAISKVGKIYARGLSGMFQTVLFLRSGIAVTVAWARGYSSDSPLAWDPPYAAGAALKRQQQQQQKI